MKARNLQILKENGFLVPPFIVVNDEDGLTPVQKFLLDDNKTYAVRSSFSMEDGAHSSFAGQFTTLLNVKKEDLPQAIKNIKNGFSVDNVQKYAQTHGIAVNKNDGRVIIQEMVPAEYSGVMFTANPLGLLNETVVVVGHGLGNGVVEDKVETTTYYYSHDDKSVYMNSSDNAPHLDEHMINKLLDTSKRIKKVLGYEADIEFAIFANHVYILQARPITTLKTNNPIVLDNSNIVESYPGVSLPLTQDFVKEIYHDIFYNLLIHLTLDKREVDKIDAQLQDMVDVANWRMYYRISNWYYVLNMLPFSKKIISIWQNMMGVQNKNVVIPINTVSSAAKRQVIKSFFYYMKTAPKHMEELNTKFNKVYPEYCALVDKADNIHELVQLYERIKKEIMSEWDITLVNDMYTFIYTFLANKQNKAALADFKNLESMKPVRALNSLIIHAQCCGMDTEEYYEMEEDYIEMYGDRCIGELKLETPTYRTNPELLHEYIQNSLNTSITISPVKSENEDKLSWIVRNARTGIQNREISRLNRSRLFGLTRYIFLKIGSLLNKSGYISQTRDVFYLHLSELENECKMQEIVTQRKALHDYYEQVPGYTRLVFAEKVFDKTGNLTKNISESSNNHLSGIATSTGITEGEVLVIKEPNISMDTKGKILVTQSTDPGWVFLIQNAAGIIAEKGSLLSHTAIISRELHKPAIVNVKDCTQILKTGDYVKMNAETGIIHIIKKEE